MSLPFVGSNAQLAATAQVIARAVDPLQLQASMSAAGLTANYTVNGDGSIFDKAAGAFLTQAQLITLLPFLPAILA